MVYLICNFNTNIYVAIRIYRFSYNYPVVSFDLHCSIQSNGPLVFCLE